MSGKITHKIITDIPGKFLIRQYKTITKEFYISPKYRDITVRANSVSTGPWKTGWFSE